MQVIKSDKLITQHAVAETYLEKYAEIRYQIS